MRDLMDDGFTTRLNRALAASDMTVSDAAVWFDRPRSTVNTWTKGRVPIGRIGCHVPSGRLALFRLELLEWALSTKKGLPIPSTVTWGSRSQYVRDTRDAAERDCGVPAVRAAS